MSKSVFLAGASGAIGRQLAPILLAGGWRVVGTTRSAEKAPMLRKLGVEPVVLDVYDAAALRAAVVEARPEVVMHQLTDLPYALAADRMADALVRNARVRIEGTRNLVAAAVAAGARRLIAQSLGFIYAEGTVPHGEEAPLLPDDHPVYGETARAVRSLEEQVLAAPLEGIVLRYGYFYGPGTGFDTPVAPGSVHVEAAAKAAELAMTRGAPGIYNVAEASPSVSSEKAIRVLGWDPGWRASR
jgi:nucleoside-diphosphate-sugar epimerase